jgi:hypothetical protein
MIGESSGPADMRLLGKRGGLKSGEVRRAKRLMRLLGPYASTRGIELDTEAPPAEPVERPNRSGGSHDTDWRCPYCRHCNSIKRRSCAKCGKTPANGRLTRAALREREVQHRFQAMLKKHGL